MLGLRSRSDKLTIPTQKRRKISMRWPTCKYRAFCHINLIVCILVSLCFAIAWVVSYLLPVNFVLGTYNPISSSDFAVWASHGLCEIRRHAYSIAEFPCWWLAILPVVWAVIVLLTRIRFDCAGEGVGTPTLSRVVWQVSLTACLLFSLCLSASWIVSYWVDINLVFGHPLKLSYVNLYTSHGISTLWRNSSGIQFPCSWGVLLALVCPAIAVLLHSRRSRRSRGFPIKPL